MMEKRKLTSIITEYYFEPLIAGTVGFGIFWIYQIAGIPVFFNLLLCLYCSACIQISFTKDRYRKQMIRTIKDKDVQVIMEAFDNE